jgi:hypothetical protein
MSPCGFGGTESSQDPAPHSSFTSAIRPGRPAALGGDLAPAAAAGGCRSGWVRAWICYGLCSFLWASVGLERHYFRMNLCKRHAGFVLQAGLPSGSLVWEGFCAVSTFDMRGLTRLAGAGPLDGRVGRHCLNAHGLKAASDRPHIACFHRDLESKRHSSARDTRASTLADLPTCHREREQRGMPDLRLLGSPRETRPCCHSLAAAQAGHMACQ